MAKNKALITSYFRGQAMYLIENNRVRTEASASQKKTVLKAKIELGNNAYAMFLPKN